MIFEYKVHFKGCWNIRLAHIHYPDAFSKFNALVEQIAVHIVVLGPPNLFLESTDSKLFSYQKYAVVKNTG